MKLAALFILLAGPGLIFAFQPPSRIHANIETAQTFALKGNIRPAIAQAQDQGAVEPALQLPRITLHLAMTDSQKADLLQLLADQQTPGNARWHQWLTPETFAAQFGVSDSDIQKIVGWLQSRGVSNIEVARSRNAISFSATAAQAEAAFQTSIHRYLVKGQAHYANATDPVLPKTLEGVVESIRGLHDFHPRPLNVKAATALKAHFTSSISGNHYLAPDDWATIYDVKPLYSNGIDGTGMKIAIPGQSDISTSDIDAFRSAAGLSKNDPQVILSGSDPGKNSGDESESDLDIEWAGGIAKNATIVFVNSTDAFGSATYVVDNNVAPVLSITYGNCEADLGAAEIDTLTAVFEQANAQGITVLAASGDEGAGDCENSGATTATQGLAVDVPAAIPYVTGVGGTQFNEGSGTYWSASNNSNSGSALSYIPEAAWNTTSADGQLAATGGGKSSVFPKPAWQTGTGVPYDNARDVPDLAFAASPDHDGFLICSDGSCVNGFRMSDQDLNVIGGTSASAPTFAAVVALLDQLTGDRQGNINPTLYALAAASTNAFHDIVSGNNQVPCQQGSTDCPANGYIGYSTGLGYDQVTGLGSVDAYRLLTEWSSYTPAALTPMPGGAEQLSVGADGTAWGLNVNGQSYSYNSQTSSWASGALDLTELAVGSSSAIWGLNSVGDVFKLNSTTQTWSSVSGNLSHIAAGADGSIWGLNSVGFIYEYNAQTQTFQQIPGTLSQIAVGFDGAVWGLNSAEQIYRFNPGAQAFEYVPGSLAQLSVGADGDVWGINYLGNIYHFDRLTQGWQQMPGTLKTISVGSGSNVYGLNPESYLFKFDSADNAWNQFNAQLRSVAASANGSVWGVSYTDQSYELLQATQSSQSWHQAPGTLTQIAVSSDGDVWGINASNQIYAFNALTQSWTLLPGDLSQITVAAGGAVWGLNASNGVFRFNVSSQKFELLPGNLSQIALADTGDAWGINSLGQIYRFNASSQNWELIPGSLSQISVGADGDAWGVDSENGVFHFNAQTQTWAAVNASLTQISAGSSANVWGLDGNGYIYRLNTASQTFELVPGILTHIAAAFDGTVWGINSGQQIYRFDSQTQNWVNVPGALTKLAIGSDAVVWGINSGGGIYHFQ